LFNAAQPAAIESRSGIDGGTAILPSGLTGDRRDTAPTARLHLPSIPHANRFPQPCQDAAFVRKTPVMDWRVSTGVLALLLLCGVWARWVWGIRRDERDSWEVLRSLHGRRVTVLVGTKNLHEHTGTLVVQRDSRAKWVVSPRKSVVIDDGRRQRWFPVGEVHSIVDPQDHSVLGGPW
jgi:hypothetical protein